MVMCVGSADCYGSRPPAHYRASIVYFPSQDAISASVVSYGRSMWGCGGRGGGGGSNKRKLEEEEEVNISYFDQRQSVLNISMIKLRSQPPRKEQPLRRSVLIFNTLKHIETELKVEGVRWNPATKPSLLPSIEPNDDLTLDPLPVESRSTGPETCPVAMETDSNSPCSPLVSAPVSMTTSDSSSMFPDSRSLFDSMFNLGTQQGPLPTFSSLLELDSCVPSSSTNKSCSSITNTSSAFSSSVSSSPSSSPSSSSPQHSAPRSSPYSSSARAPSSPAAPTEHDPLSDFDFAALDLDFFSFLPSSLKLPPLSAEDLQSLPHPEVFPPSLSSSCNPKHSDLLGDDLDSIMQILVGM